MEKRGLIYIIFDMLFYYTQHTTHSVMANEMNVYLGNGKLFDMGLIFQKNMWRCFVERGWFSFFMGKDCGLTDYFQIYTFEIMVGGWFGVTVLCEQIICWRWNSQGDGLDSYS